MTVPPVELQGGHSMVAKNPIQSKNFILLFFSKLAFSILGGRKHLFLATTGDGGTAPQNTHVQRSR